MTLGVAPAAIFKAARRGDRQAAAWQPLLAKKSKET